LQLRKRWRLVEFSFFTFIIQKMPRVVLSKSDKLAAAKSNNSCENLTQYCLNSSLHGLKYCGTRNLSFFERFFFGISFAFVMILAGYFISNIWQKWQESPVIVSGNPEFTKIQVSKKKFKFCSTTVVGHLSNEKLPLLPSTTEDG
jgi:hypothetical protein